MDTDDSVYTVSQKFEARISYTKNLPILLLRVVEAAGVVGHHRGGVLHNGRLRLLRLHGRCLNRARLNRVQCAAHSGLTLTHGGRRED